VVAYSILVSAQGPLVLGLGLKSLGLKGFGAKGLGPGLNKKGSIYNHRNTIINFCTAARFKEIHKGVHHLFKVNVSISRCVSL